MTKSIKAHNVFKSDNFARVSLVARGVDVYIDFDGSSNVIDSNIAQDSKRFAAVKKVALKALV